MLMQILHGDGRSVTFLETVAAAIATHYSRVTPLGPVVYAPSGRRRMARGRALDEMALLLGYVVRYPTGMDFTDANQAMAFFETQAHEPL
jgi:hypothetical protein